MRVRLAKRERLVGEGVAPYPVTVPRTHTLRQVRETWGGLTAGEETQERVAVTGRVVLLRNTGKLCFATLAEGLDQTSSGARLQVMLSLAEVGEQRLAAWKADVDLGDFVAVEGRVISSKRGELSVMAGDWTLASKALRPLPTLHAELSDELRVRQRYADLIVREAARDMVRARATVTRSVRETLHRSGFVEIETPVLQLVHGGANARPFATHLNAFDIDMTLRIALELFLKRAVVGGVENVYELGRIFRNEGVDSSHSPEFTMLEFYQSWGDQRTVAEITRQIVLDAADALGSRQLETPNGVVDLDGEWRWLGVYPGLSEAVGETVDPDTDAATLRRIAERHDVALDPAWDAEKIVLELFEALVEPGLLQPTFVCDYPPSAQPLARPHRSDPRLIEAWDLIIAGVERGTGFSELIDPVIQRERLYAQSLAAAAGDPEAMQLDEDFLAALEFGAPPMGGVGIGIDRLMMLFTGAGIRETILFPLLRPGS
ncbi:lysine--tRNA ligase [Microlunatus kandeliicorticis]|uniref:lysine--tRNA ligase n=1 Tax=Microlunatus kandeliicorticis TaxID=1759536 RepID=UPI002E2C68A6|nr:lysine--tRNA ligase [Microlunatus kandeliicorticis]